MSWKLIKTNNKVLIHAIIYTNSEKKQGNYIFELTAIENINICIYFSVLFDNTIASV